MRPLLEFSSVSFTIGRRDILHDVSLAISPGELVVLAGPNGAGKTTLLRLALGFLRAQDGVVRLGDDDIARLPRLVRAARVAWLPQSQPNPSLLTAREVVATGRYRFDEPRGHSLRVAERLLNELSADDLTMRQVSTLSGGQLQCVALATTLAQETPIVLLDEPGNHLDPYQRAEMFARIGSLAARGVAVLCVTHDVGLIETARTVDRAVEARVVGLVGGRKRFEVAAGVPELGALISQLFEPMASVGSPPAVGERASVRESRTVFVVAVVSVALVMIAPAIGDSLTGALGEFIFWELRVPRALMGALVGGVLGITGAALQTLFENPLAAPSTVGTMAGATLGGMTMILLGVPGGALGLSLTTLGAFAGALLLSLGVVVVAARGHARMTDVLLAGVAVSLASAAIATGLQAVADAKSIAAAVQWSLGHLPQVGFGGVALLCPLAAISVAGVWSQTRALETMAGGEMRASAQGVDIPRLRVLVIGFGSLGVAACVALCGPISFVGLIVPHLVRFMCGASVRTLVPMSAIVGAAFLVACDVGARVMFPGRELPVGVITSALGAVAMVLVIGRNGVQGRP